MAIEIKPKLADYVSENVWHSTQSIEPMDDGSIRVRFRLGNLEEICQWILGWGDQAKALEPPELRELLKARAQAICMLYD